MILLTNGDSWTQGDSSPQIPNWEATKTLDWYDIIPNFGDTTINKKQSILYKFYDSPLWPKVLGEKLGFETWNAGRLGTSNDNIFRTTINSINYLEPLGKKDIFVVIAFTSLIRYEIFQPNEEKKSIYECQRIDHKKTCPEKTFDLLIISSIDWTGLSSPHSSIPSSKVPEILSLGVPSERVASIWK